MTIFILFLTAWAGTFVAFNKKANKRTQISYEKSIDLRCAPYCTGRQCLGKSGDEVKGAVKASVSTAAKNGVYNLVYRGTSLVKVIITNAAGEVVLTDQINAEGGFVRPYNFTSHRPARTR
jgi:hypothetical protein